MPEKKNAKTTQMQFITHNKFIINSRESFKIWACRLEIIR